MGKLSTKSPLSGYMTLDETGGHYRLRIKPAMTSSSVCNNSSRVHNDEWIFFEKLTQKNRMKEKSPFGAFALERTIR